MALFFDKAWFDSAIRDRNLSRADLAVVVGASEEDITAIFKDQMEVPPSHVAAWAALLGTSNEEIALRCGVSTRALEPVDDSKRIVILESRIAALEAIVGKLAKQLGEGQRLS